MKLYGSYFVNPDDAAKIITCICLEGHLTEKAAAKWHSFIQTALPLQLSEVSHGGAVTLRFGLS